MTPVMCRVAVSQHASIASGWNRLAGVLRMELWLTFRDPALLLVVIGLLAFCQLLMPPVDAPYAVLTANNLKPVMSADTMTLAVGTVFGAIAFPAYLLYLGGRWSRDAAAGLGPLYLSSSIFTPQGAVSLVGGRLLANTLLALGSVFVVLALLIVSVFLRVGEWPGITGTAAYLDALVPVILAAAVIAMILDATVPINSLKASIVFCLWVLLLIASLVGRNIDFFGLRFLGENILPGRPAPSLSVGFISGKVGTVPWNIVRESATHLWGRFQLAGAVIGTGVVACFVLSATFRSRYAPVITAAEKVIRPDKADVVQSSAPAASHVLALPMQLKTRRVAAWRVLFIVARGRLANAKWAKLLIVTASFVAAAAPQTASAAAIALLIPVALFGRMQRRNLALGRAVRFTTPSLWRPTPHLLESFALCALVVAPMSLRLIRDPFDPMRCIHFVAGALAASTWMVCTHYVMKRELLGVSTYLLLWYFVACNRLPATLDVLAVHGTSIASFSIAVMLASVLCVAIARADRTR